MKNGRYGSFGGAYIPEILHEPIQELIQAWNEAEKDPEFKRMFVELLQQYAGRPTPLTEVKRFSEAIDGPRIFLKREDLLHTGAHKINNTLGQCLLAKRMGKTRIIAETGAGQHGLATATACARFGLECIVFMGSKDVERQKPNVEKMELLGARVESVDKGAKTLKEAVNEALREWSKTYETSHYCLGSALGPHPFPNIVASFHAVIGEEVQKQLSCEPHTLIACVGGGSNAIGLFAPYLNSSVQLIGVEAGGHGNKLGMHAARFNGGSPGVLHGCYTYLLQDENGQIVETSSISAGLDYPAIGPQHAELHDSGRATYTSVTDEEALDAFTLLSKTEGIIPALESSHALAYLKHVASDFPKDACVVVNLSGRGDKDLPYLLREYKDTLLGGSE